MRSFVPDGLDAALGPYRDLATAYSQAASPQDVRTVAVVGNAPMSPDARRADVIDSCDLVIRVNGFQLDAGGASADAAYGSRADVAVLAMASHPSAWTFADHPRRLYFLANASTIHFGVLHRPTWPSDLGAVYIPNREVTLPFADALGMPTRTQQRWPTTGTTAIGLAAALFPWAHLVLAGFSFIDEPDQSSWEHVTGSRCARPAEHDFAKESALMRKWMEQGRVTDVRHAVPPRLQGVVARSRLAVV